MRFTTVRRFLENGADINTDKIFRTHADQKLAADRKLDVDMLQDENQWRSDLRWHPRSIFTPLALAAALGHGSMVAFLLDHGADIEKPGKGLCVCSQGENIVQLHFPPHGGYGGVDDEEYIMDDESAFCWTPLHIALCRGHESTAMLLLQRGANYKVTCPCEAGPWNALHTATRMNQQNVISHLLDDKRVNINEPGHQGLTPLHLAFYEKHYSLVQMYVRRGADTNAVWHSDDGGWTLFAMACLRDKFSTASDLLRRGADPDFVLIDAEIGCHWTALGLIYANMCRALDSSFPLQTDTPKTRQRRNLEEQIIQARIDKALQEQRKKDRD